MEVQSSEVWLLQYSCFRINYYMVCICYSEEFVTDVLVLVKEYVNQDMFDNISTQIQLFR